MDEVFVFSDEELHRALSEKIGIARDVDPTTLPNPDPGTITMPEVQDQYSLGRDSARKYVGQLLAEKILFRDWVYRRDPWPPYKKKKLKGYRFADKELDK